jgi:hypothetical protein
MLQLAGHPANTAKALDHFLVGIHPATVYREHTDCKLEFIRRDMRTGGMADYDSVGDKLRELKARSGRSLSQIADAWGNRKKASVQRYFEPGFRPGGLLDLDEAIGIAAALVTFGDPPITHDEIFDLTALPQMPEAAVLQPLSEPVAVEMAQVLAQVALGGQKPSDDVVEALSSILVELSRFYQSEPAARRDPAETRGALRLLAQRFARRDPGSPPA